MKQATKNTLIGIIALLFIDTLGSIASNRFEFSYSYLSIISLLIYIAIAFVSTRQINKKTGIIIAAILGLVDATIGWKISMMLGANTGSKAPEMTPKIWMMTAILMTLFAGFLGWIGAWLATKIKREH